MVIARSLTKQKKKLIHWEEKSHFNPMTKEDEDVLLLTCWDLGECVCGGGGRGFILL